MQTSHKIFIIFFLVLTILFTLSGCVNNSQGSENDNGNSIPSYSHIKDNTDHTNNGNSDANNYRIVSEEITAGRCRVDGKQPAAVYDRAVESDETGLVPLQRYDQKIYKFEKQRIAFGKRHFFDARETDGRIDRYDAKISGIVFEP